MKQYRNEWKYVVSEQEMAAFQVRLQDVLNTDTHIGEAGMYQVHSVYFDDLYDSCARENDQGVSNRFKYRIRYYDDQPDFIRLEKKEKCQERCYKRSARLSTHEYEQIMQGEYSALFWESENALVREFCVDCMTKQFTPKAIIDYERYAYVEEATNVRVTLDTNISVGNEFEHFLDGDYLRMPIQGRGMHVLEVKFDSILPSYVRHILTDDRLVRTAFSKYYLGREMLSNRK